MGSLPIYERAGPLAKRLGITPSTLHRWRELPGFPQPIALGPNTTVYPVEEVERWVNSRPRGGARAPQAALRARGVAVKASAP